MDVTIRDARTEDAQRLAALLDQLGYPASVGAVARRARLLAASDSDRLLVAELAGEVVGLAILHVGLAIEHDRPVAKLGAIVVDERHRRRGIGEALVRAVEAEARARDCYVLFLTTAERRLDAHAFYGRLGFHETGRRFVKPLE